MLQTNRQVVDRAYCRAASTRRLLAESAYSPSLAKLPTSGLDRLDAQVARRRSRSWTTLVR